jgi:hypothetical protein
MMNKMVKDTMKLGIGSMAGMAALGAVSNAPGMPSEAKNVSNLASSGIVLANVGQFGKNAIGISNMMGQGKKKKSGNYIVDKILG